MNIARLYDPIGLLGPVIVAAKLIMQPGLPGIWGRKSPEQVGEVAKSRQIHNRSESPKSRHHLRQKISDDLKKKTTKVAEAGKYRQLHSLYR